MISLPLNNYVEPTVGRKYMSHDILKALKPKIKQWVALNKSNEESRKKDLTNDLRTLDDKIEAGLASNVDRDNRIKILQEMHNLVNLDDMDMFQKACVKWDVEGDENTKFFHGLINQRRRTQAINGIMHDGVWITNPNQIKEVFLNFFKEKFQANDSTVTFPPTSLPNTLHQFDRDYLEASLTMDEVKNAVWDCGSDKAPGPDGYNFAFLKRYWDIFKQGIFEFVSTFLNSKKMPSGANSSFITLIPKITNPIHIKDYRPISLIGIHYKSIAEILANRLSVVIDKLISHEQTAFIKGRQILDGPLILSELIEWYKKRKKKMLLFKVNFEKAFDTSIAAPVITISSDATEESVGSVVTRVILFSTIPTEIPIVLDIPTDLPTAPELPAVSPFLCSDDIESDLESEPVDELPKRHVSLRPFSVMVSRWRAKVISCPSSPSGPSLPDTTIPSAEILVSPIPPALSTEISITSPTCETLTPVIAASLAIRSRIRTTERKSTLGLRPMMTPAHSASPTSESSSTAFLHGTKISPEDHSHHSFEVVRSPSDPLTRKRPQCSDYATPTSFSSVGPSRKRSRSSTTSIPSIVHTAGALSPAQADLLPPHKRYRGTSATHSYESSDEVSLETHVESDMDSDIQADVEAETVATAAATVDEC
ncbi:putative RNA-directed DNA polymerase, eukaryota, reverse transcriptase zinc-binding domain protein [Tanacetum coccineum]